MQHDSRHLGPIRALGLGIEEAQISDEMFVIVISQTVSVRSLVGNRWIERRLGHDHSASIFNTSLPWRAKTQRERLS